VIQQLLEGDFTEGVNERAILEALGYSDEYARTAKRRISVDP